MNKETLKALIRFMLLKERDIVFTPFAMMIWIFLISFIYIIYKILNFYI